MQKLKFRYFSKILGAAFILLLFCSCSVNFFTLVPYSKTTLKEITIKDSETITKNKLLLIDITGELTSMTSSGIFKELNNSVDTLKEILEKAKEDPNIKAIVLRIDSPGGEVTAADLMYNELMEFKKQTKKKVYSIFMGAAASGGYYIAMASDKIYSIPTTITGSFGVITTLPNFQNLTNKIGVDVRVIKSGDKKDIGSIWREFTPEEKAILQGMIDSLHARFIDIIALNRKTIEKDKIKTLADGRIFNAESALKEGLIDQIAYPEQALDNIKKSNNLKDYKLITYIRKYDYKSNYYSKNSYINDNSAKTEINLLKLENFTSAFKFSPKFYYLWIP